MCVLVGSGVVEAYAGHSQQMLCLTCKDERERERKVVEGLWRDEGGGGEEGGRKEGRGRRGKEVK